MCLSQTWALDGKRQGGGKMIYKNGDRYDGQWYNNKRWGMGSAWYANGDRYDGEWARDVHNYKGSMRYANGDRYEGDWMDNMRHVSPPPPTATHNTALLPHRHVGVAARFCFTRSSPHPPLRDSLLDDTHPHHTLHTHSTHTHRLVPPRAVVSSSMRTATSTRANGAEVSARARESRP